VLNGTCNYILTKIENEGISFAQALKEAQAAGFAEADPTDDVDGYDARAKLVILSRVGLRAQVRPEQIACRSIRPVEMIDFAYAHDLYTRSTVRQIARAELRDGRLFASVQPALVRRDSPLAQLVGGQNLVVSTGTYGGETVFSGHGAGGNPTAVAVVSDLVAVARNRSEGLENLSSGATSVYPVTSDFLSPHYVRFNVRDQVGIIAALATALANHGINIEAVLQKPGCVKTALPFVFTLEQCSTSMLEGALEEISKFDFLTQPPVHLPILS
jgi:homoserine dehydrogenase